MNLKSKAKEIKIFIPALFIAIKRKDTPILAKVFAGVTLIYALSPIDLIPDFIPILGYLDDAIILPLLATLTIKFIPTEIMDECKTESEGIWTNGKPKKWYFAIPTLIIWLLICRWLIMKFI
ncbi:MAG: YkvA family protein [Eubacteriaceae bacterium]